MHKELSVENAEAVTWSDFFQFYNYLPLNRLLNANKINCLRVDAFQDLHNLNLLSLYDNKLQTIAKGTFSPLRAIQTLYVCSCLWISQVWLHTLQCSKSTGYCWDQREIMCDITGFFFSMKGIWLRTHLSVTAIWSGWRIISTQTPLRPAVPVAPAPAGWQTKGSARSKARNSAAQVIFLVQLLFFLYCQKKKKKF